MDDNTVYAEPTDQAIEASLESKVVCIRDGSCSYTADEICWNLIDEARALGIEVPSTDDIPESDDEDYSQILGEYADEAESLLNDAGYQVFHNDGFVIYKDLTDEESDYLGGY